MRAKGTPVLQLWCTRAGLALLGCARFGYDALDPESDTRSAEHCSNGSVDADEANVDCGGNDCPACLEASLCRDDAGCGSAACPSGECPAAATCSDGIQNQDETRVDCGGAVCSACASCSDSIRGEDETGVDCGGASCGRCPDGSRCQRASDCLSAVCGADETCSAASCDDGIQNRGEVGVDCGGDFCAACASCSDGIVNQDEAGVDCGGASCAACGVNTAPLASLTVRPGLGSHDGTPATVFQGDASATTDREDAAITLAYTWDWDEDGVTDAIGVTSSHVYGVAGVFTVRLAVQDTGGLSATGTSIVIVSSDNDVVRVTTALDEDDDGATPASPGGTGLSLREAIGHANGHASRPSILVPAGFSISLQSRLPNPSNPFGMDIIGDGARLDGAGTGPADDCLSIDTPNHRVSGFEIQNCRRSAIRLAAGAAGSQLSRLNIHDNGQPVILNDRDVHFGPDNEVSSAVGDCVSVLGQNATLDWNHIHDCEGRGVELTGTADGALLLGNVVSRSDPGVLFGTGADNLTLLHNVIHAHRGDGLLVGVSVAGTVLQNNIFSSNAAFGVRGADSVFVSNDHNAYFANGVGTCTDCSLGSGSLTFDPEYMDASAEDFRLQPASPLINAGIDTGHDSNRASAGLFNGSSPDIGARETP